MLANRIEAAEGGISADMAAILCVVCTQVAVPVQACLKAVISSSTGGLYY
jgi:hypothetical protein